MRYDRSSIPVAALVVVGLGTIALAQVAGVFDLSHGTLQASGGKSTGGAYELRSTVHHPTVGVSSGGDYELLSGFIIPEPGNPEGWMLK